MTTLMGILTAPTEDINNIQILDKEFSLNRLRNIQI